MDQLLDWRSETRFPVGVLLVEVKQKENAEQSSKEYRLLEANYNDSANYLNICDANQLSLAQFVNRHANSDEPKKTLRGLVGSAKQYCVFNTILVRSENTWLVYSVDEEKIRPEVKLPTNLASLSWSEVLKKLHIILGYDGFVVDKARDGKIIVGLINSKNLGSDSQAILLENSVDKFKLSRKTGDKQGLALLRYLGNEGSFSKFEVLLGDDDIPVEVGEKIILSQ